MTDFVGRNVVKTEKLICEQQNRDSFATTGLIIYFLFVTLTQLNYETENREWNRKEECQMTIASSKRS